MHFAHGKVPEEYLKYTGRKNIIILLLTLGLVAALVLAISMGSAMVPVSEVVKALLGQAANKRFDIIVWNIRLPQALSAIMAGAGLSAAGLALQSILRNPLGSPLTLGISHAAAFGAAFSVMVLGTGLMTSTNVGAVSISNPYVTTLAAFVASVGTSLVIIGISRLRGTKPETMILAGVALNALFTAGTMFLQYFADDVQLAAMVFWTFGDTARASWSELGFISVITILACVYFIINAWNYNAIDAGDETAKGLGVQVQKVRMTSMFIAALVIAVVTAFLGIIGFVGLVTPHMVRLVVGGDHRFLMPASIVGGGLLLLVSDTVARMVLIPHILPVSILTAFMGAPVFIWLIMRGGLR